MIGFTRNREVVDEIKYMSDTTNTDDWRPDSEDSQPDPLALLGQVIAGKYRIESFIGEGGFGKVYTGVNVNLVEQKVVIKFFTQAKLRDRFDKEAQILCKLDHPSICSLIDYLPAEHALVIPFIDGVDLRRQLKETGPLPPDQFMTVVRSVLDAIEFAHNKSIAHRDIKPSNIMIDRNDNVCIIDFGIAKEITETSTKTSFFVGTPDFAAPERRKDNPGYNPFISDIYELGVTFYYLATNRHLYQDRDDPDFHDWDLPATNKLSSRMKRILKKATHPDPARRYQSIEEMIQEFDKVSYPYRRKSVALRSIAAAAAIAAVVIGADAANQRYHFADVTPLIRWSSVDSIVPDTTLDANTVSNQESFPIAVTDELPSDTETVAIVPPPEETVNESPPAPEMKIDVQPPGCTGMEIDGRSETIGEYFETTPGQHEILIEHGDFPLFRSFALVSASDTARLSFDLRDRYPSLDSAKLMLLILPRIDGYGFDLYCNGKPHRFDKSREFNFYLKNGSWRVSADVRRLTPGGVGKPQVDSIVVGVVGKTITRNIAGNAGLVNVSSGPAGDQIMKLLIYWSEIQGNARR